MLDFAQARRTMVDCQVRTFDVVDHALLSVLEEVPRERFVPAAAEATAYSDRAITLARFADGTARVMLPPMVLARMIQALDIVPGSRILDVAGGTGYASAVMERLGGDVVMLEAYPALAERAKAILSDLGCDVAVQVGPVAEGYAAGAPYDLILVNGAYETVPDELLAQLADGGRLAAVDASEGAGRVVLFQRAGEAVGSRRLFDAAAPVIEGLRRAPSFQF